MKDPRLSQKEGNLYIMASIPAIIFCIVISLFYSSRLSRIYPPGSQFDPVLWDMFTYFIIPVMTIAPLLFIITFEILNCRRTKGAFNFHAKRLVRSVVTQYIAVAIFTSVYVLSLVFLLPLTSAGLTLAIVGIAWALLFYAVMRRLKRLLI